MQHSPLWQIYQQSSLQNALKFLNFRILPIFDLGYYDGFFCPKPASLSRADAHPLDRQHLNCLPAVELAAASFSLRKRHRASHARFAYFEIHTDWRSLFVGPLIAGFLFAAAKPWISLGMDWLGAWAIHRSRLHADRLAEDRSSKRLDLQAESLQKEDEIENEVIDQAIERRKKLTKRS